MPPAERRRRKWEHFPHGADVGVRGRGRSLAEAFAAAGQALTAIVTPPLRVRPEVSLDLMCSAPDSGALLVEWLNLLIYAMATRGLLFRRYKVRLDGGRLRARAWGEPLAPARHQPALEPKGATYTALKVGRRKGGWVAQCVVDV